MTKNTQKGTLGTVPDDLTNLRVDMLFPEQGNLISSDLQERDSKFFTYEIIKYALILKIQLAKLSSVRLVLCTGLFNEPAQFFVQLLPWIMTQYRASSPLLSTSVCPPAEQVQAVEKREVSAVFP